MRMLLTLVMILAFAGSALAQGVLVEDFEGGANNGGWTWGNSYDTIESDGGNPGGWLHNDNLMTFAPILRSGWDAPGWTGDFVSMGVTRISGDFQTLSTTNSWSWDDPFCVFFRNHMGTPLDIEDDVYVYYNPYAHTCPDPGEGFENFTFDVPSDFIGAPGELPANWMGGSYHTGNASFPSDVTWQDVMSNVGRVEFWFIHPDWASLIQSYDSGVDNLILEWVGGPVATEEATWGDLKALYR